MIKPSETLAAIRQRVLAERGLDAPTHSEPTAVALQGEGTLSPVRYPNLDMFLCDLFDYTLKDDGVSMEAPIFTLATKPDLSIWEWVSKDKTRSLTVTPSVLGRATQFDKDILIYVISQMTAARNQGRPDANTRTVQFKVYDYLVATNKPTGGAEYDRVVKSLSRLQGTSMKTNIKTGGESITEGFGLLERWKVVEKSPMDDRMLAVELTLSRWLFNAIRAHEVLTINRDYFRLRKPLERRIYELARKHCGNQQFFSISLALLLDKCGSKASLKEFRRNMRDLIEANGIPDYVLVFNEAEDSIAMFPRVPPALSLQ